jgi:hypothetical protein
MSQSQKQSPAEWARSVDPARDETSIRTLARAIEMHAERTDVGVYRVWGGRDPHWVNLYDTNQDRCDCAHHLLGMKVCKHIMAALLREGMPLVVKAVPFLTPGDSHEH